MTTIQTVQEQPTGHSAAEGASSDQGAPDEPQASPAAERRRSPVLLDHAERLARIETLILNGAISPAPTQQP